MKKNYKVSLLISMSALLVSGMSLGVGLTIAGFAATDRADQSVYSTAGELKKSFFLDCETLWNVTGTEVYYMKCWHSSTSANAWILPTKSVTITVSNNNAGTRTLYVFEYDSTIYNKVMFARVNPNGLTTANIDSQIWNQTYDRSYSSSINYYYMSAWASGNKTTNYKGTISSSGAVTNYSIDPNSNS